MIYIGALITFFPGIIVYVLIYLCSKLEIYGINKLESYILALGTVILCNVLIFRDFKLMLIVFFMILVVYVQLNVYFFRRINLRNNKKLYIMILIPVVEEFVFRFYYMKYIKMCEITILWSIIFNVIIFIFLHAYRENIYAIKKIVIALLLILIYVYSGNLSLCITVHIVYNSLCYVLEEKTN